MNFTKHTWTTGETVTAALLNRIENAVYELSQVDNTEATSQQAINLCDSLFEHFLED